MTALAVAIRPLPVEVDGERVVVHPNEVIPNFDQWPRRAREAVLDNEKAVELPDHVLIAEAVASVPEFAEALFAALAECGYKVAKATAKKD